MSEVIINPPVCSHMPSPVACHDCLDFGVYVDGWKPEDLVGLIEEARFDVSRNLGCDGLHIAGFVLKVAPEGRRVGNGQGPHYKYVLLDRDSGVEILLNPRGCGPSIPNVRVSLKGRFFLVQGDGRYGYNLIEQIIRELGGQISHTELSRVDLALDVPCLAIAKLLKAYEVGAYISRSQDQKTYMSDCSTVYFGTARSAVRCVIYDKLCESRKKKVLNLMKARRWGGVIPDYALRLEFRLRRSALKHRGIDTVEDLFEREGDLVDNLMTRWLRFTCGPVDRTNNNQSRAKTLPLWDELRQAFVEGFGGLTGLPLNPLPRERMDISQLGKQAVGVVIRAAGEERIALPSRTAFLTYADKLMTPFIGSRLPFNPGS